jgi:hypothetical protein
VFLQSETAVLFQFLGESPTSVGAQDSEGIRHCKRTTMPDPRRCSLSGEWQRPRLNLVEAVRRFRFTPTPQP